MWRHPVGKCKIIPCFRREIGRFKVEHPVYNLPHASTDVRNGVKLSDRLDMPDEKIIKLCLNKFVPDFFRKQISTMRILYSTVLHTHGRTQPNLLFV